MVTKRGLTIGGIGLGVLFFLLLWNMRIALFFGISISVWPILLALGICAVGIYINVRK